VTDFVCVLAWLNVNRACWGLTAEFEVLSELGRGTYGTVLLARSQRDDELYVLKRIHVKHLSVQQQRAAISEVLLLQRVNHAHVIRYHTSFVRCVCVCVCVCVC
jgi:serine/threonine protein kinase